MREDFDSEGSEGRLGITTRGICERGLKNGPLLWVCRVIERIEGWRQTGEKELEPMQE